MSSPQSTKVVWTAFGANLGIAAAKFAGAAVSGSAALLAEAVHSLVDTANQLLLLFGGRAARKPPCETHPLGHGREAFFWSFIVAMLLFSMGGLFAIREGVHKLGAAEPISSPWLGLIILAVSMVLESISYRACLKEIRARERACGLWDWFRKASDPDLLVVFMEDTAALAGLAAAALCLASAWLTGNPAWDAAGSIIVGSILVVVALILAMEIKSLLVGEAPAKDYRPEVERIVAEELPQARVLRFLALQTGPSEVLVSYKVAPGPVKDVPSLIAAFNRAELRIKERFPEVRWQFVEPDDQE